MNVNRLPAVVLMAGALTAPATAVADQSHRYPGQRPATDPWTLQTGQFAVDYWNARGITGCTPVQIDVADDLRETGDDPNLAQITGRAWEPPGECRIVLNAAWLGRELRLARRPWPGWRRQRYGVRLKIKRAAVQAICVGELHEIGHTRGLAHSDNQASVMYPYTNEITMPAECVILSHRLIPRRKAT